MRKRNSIMWISTLIVLLSACFTEQGEYDSPGRIEAIFSLEKDTGPGERATGGEWEIYDRIGIFMYENGTVLADETIREEAYNRQYITTSQTGHFEPSTNGETIYYPRNSEQVNFISYYPYHTDDKIENYRIPVSVTTQNVPSAIDYLYSDNARGKSKDNPVAPLTFDHVMSKLEFTIIPGSDISYTDLNNFTVRLNGFADSGMFSLTDGSVTPLSSYTTISALQDYVNYTSEVTIIPGGKSGTETRELVFDFPHLPGITRFTETIADTRTYLPGSIYRYQVKVHSNRIELHLSIEDWKNENFDKDAYPNSLLYQPNSYRITPGDSQIIPIGKAYAIWKTQVAMDPAHVDLSGNPEIELIWQDKHNLVTGWELEGNNSRATFTVQTHSQLEGNAVIGVKIGGIVRWSWHLWITSYDPDEKMNGRTWINHNGYKETEFMDRNLGALSAVIDDPGTIGMYYQFGRKDPFAGPETFIAGAPNKKIYSYTGGELSITRQEVNASPNIHNSVMKPLTFYYGSIYNTSTGNLGTTEWYSMVKTENYMYMWATTKGDKGIYDPCPRGWRVPLSGRGTVSPWGTNSGHGGLLTAYGANYEEAQTLKIGYYPFAGSFRADSGEIQEVTTASFCWSASSPGTINMPADYFGFFFRIGRNSNTINHNPENTTRPSYGMQVRCVRDK